MIVCCLTEALCQPCRILQQTETDPRRLCSLSGSWFTEECNKRHRIWSGSALIHATIRHRKTKSRGPFSVNTLLLLQACGAVFPTAIGIPHWCGYVVCCYSNRCTPVWTVQWRERENLPQQQHLSWGWEKTEGHKGRGEWRVSAACHRKNYFTVCRCNLPKSLIFVLFSGVKGVWNLHPYPEQKVPEQRSVCACLLLCLFLKNNNLNINNHLQLQDLQHTNSSSSSKGTVASPSGFCTGFLVLLLIHLSAHRIGKEK